MLIDWEKVKSNGWPNKEVKVLSIDGGGIKGIYAARYLARIEEEIGEPIHKYFDLITGTSTGGIIALGLSLGIPAKEIEDLYYENAQLIFKPKRRLIHKLKMGNLNTTSYDSNALRKLLEEKFGDRLLKDSKTFLCIPAVEHSKAKPKVFKTPHNKSLHIDAKLKMVDVALSTAAAPTFFKAHSVNGHDCKIDGGLWANNPSVIGIAEAIVNDINIKDIKVLSIGTGANVYDADNNIAIKGGILNWGKRLIDLILNVQADGALFTAKHLIGHNLKRVNFIPTRQLSLDSTAVSDLNYMKQEADDSFADTFRGREDVFRSFFLSEKELDLSFYFNKVS